MTVFSLVHGGQQGAWCFDPLAAALDRLGHRSVAVDLPIGDPGAGASEYADAVVASLRDVDAEVVVVGHSLGGLAIPLVAERRPVSRLVFLCAAVPVTGTSLLETLAEGDTRAGEEAPQLLDEAAGSHLTPREEAREVFFPDLPRALQDWALDRQRAQSERPHRETSPLHTWPGVPAAVVHGLDDRCIPIERGRRIARRVFGQAPVEIDDGHFPFLADPGRIAHELDRLVSGAAGAWPLHRALEATPPVTAAGARERADA